MVTNQILPYIPLYGNLLYRKNKDNNIYDLIINNMVIYTIPFAAIDQLYGNT